MSALVVISDPRDETVLAAHKIHRLPVLVIFPHNQCNCRCVMCDIWRIREAKQITPADIEPHLDSFKKLGVRWVVFSGGEPQLNEKWSCLAQILRSADIRVTMLTAGLLLKAQAETIVESVNDVIVSLDGPPAIHNRVRRVANAFEQLAEGVKAIHQLRPEMTVSARCTVQKANRTSLREVAASARQIGLASISFLAADLTSSAFNRPDGWSKDRSNRITLTPREIFELETEIEYLIAEEDGRRFIAENAVKLRRIVQHFRAFLNQGSETAPRCNAPWVSAVIEASGDLRPCFFHPVLGNIHSRSLEQIINGPEALQFRANLDVSTNPTCRSCVCSLYIPQAEGPAPSHAAGR
jgi:MoaA/NifB/PqqE/SkfB family radical SAM enzyme